MKRLIVLERGQAYLVWAFQTSAARRGSTVSSSEAVATPNAQLSPRRSFRSLQAWESRGTLSWYVRQVASKGNCWLCQRYGELSEEHVPPRAAFNRHPILLEEVSRHTRETGILTWEAGEPRQRGFTVRSLCGRCNSLAGQRYAPPYIEFLKTVAERVGDVRVRHQLTIQKVRKPQLILKQVIHQFVTTNGPTFARANEWVRPFLRVEGHAVLPPEIHVYMFATNTPSVRTTGISGHIYADLNRINIVSEFTF